MERRKVIRPPFSTTPYRHTRKLGHSTRREYEMQAKKREAERRKAEVMAGCTSGMRHTARAMASR